MMRSGGWGPWLLVWVAGGLVGCPGPAPVPPETDAGPLDGGPPGCRLDSDCDDGLFCNGAEMCQPASDARDGRGCVDAPAGPCLPTQTCDEAADACLSDCDLMPDADGDGAAAAMCGGDDCDDADANRAPGRLEVCDAGDHDEDCDPTTFGDRDRDRDTFFDAACCNVGASGARTCGDDCDDGAGAVSPIAAETCDGRDNDCDASIDEGVTMSGYADEDGDLHGDPLAPREACPGAGRFSLLPDDCDDTNNRVHAAQVEVCDALDNDCNGVVDDRTRPVTWYRDADGDGFGSAAGGTMISCTPVAGYELLPIDCDDTRAGTSPIATEACNGRDDDCDGAADYEIGPGDREDDDRDGFVDASCGGLGDDCDDRDPGVHPGAEAYCDGRDHDCDGAVDVGAPVAWYRDEDGDGFGAGAAMMSCAPPTGYVRLGGDCDDSLPRRSPAEPDDCDGLDDDCDAAVDEDATRVAFYPDADGDGAGGGTPILSCVQPAGYGLYPTDCDDADRTRYEGALELCNGVDDDCDGTPDEAAEVVCTVPGATASCVAGACMVSGCVSGFADCDATTANGCEVDTRTDPLHCGSCAGACPSGPGSAPRCSASACGITCDAGRVDCDGVAANGCEAVLDSDPFNCGVCGRRCASRDHAPATCAAGACGIACEAGWTDCDASVVNGCEVNTAVDPLNCGACGSACPLASDACYRGDCLPHAFPSDGSDGPLVVAAGTNLVIPPGVYQHTTITIGLGARVTTNGMGVLELRATGDVFIEGTVDLSGRDGGSNTSSGTGASGGATADPLAAVTASCLGGAGGVGTPGTAGVGCAMSGGRFGGGGGGSTSSSGGGGGGYAGGGGGTGAGTDTTAPGGVGGAVSPATGGASGCGPGEPDDPVYAGGPCAGAAGGGGGSIGLPATTDLAVVTTFRPGSAGGGGRGLGDAFNPGCGGGGGGGGGALRISSYTRIVVTSTGRVLANGGDGGLGRPIGWGIGGRGGGGSGGVIYLAAPELDMHGEVSAVGGTSGPPASTSTSIRGGAGGPGRIRLSVLRERCSLLGSWAPALVLGCAPTRLSPVPGRVYIDEYPF